MYNTGIGGEIRTSTSNNSMLPAQNPYDAWCVPDSQGSDVGSYAPNGWMCNPPRSMSSLWGRRPVVIEAPTAEDTNATL